MKTTIKYLFLTAALGIVTAQAQSQVRFPSQRQLVPQLARPVVNIALAVRVVAAQVAAAKNDETAILAIVTAAVKANPRFAGVIVFAAIRASEASNALVGQIVLAARNAAPPSQSGIIVAFASRAAPDARDAIAAAAVRPILNAARQPAPSWNSFNPLRNPTGGLARLALIRSESQRGRPGGFFDSSALIIANFQRNNNDVPVAPPEMTP